MCHCGDGAWTAQASGGCAPPGPATRWSPLRGDCAALRSPRAHGRTRCAFFERSAQTCGRESEGWARWRAPRPWPCAARHRVLCRPRRGAATARSHDLDRANKHPAPIAVPRSGMQRSPACHGTAFAARSGRPAPVPAPSGGAVSSAGDEAARDRAPPLLTHGPCPSAASPPGTRREFGRAPRRRAARRSRPMGPTATPGRNRCRASGSRARHSSHGSGAHGRHAPMSEALTLQTD